MGWKPKHPAFEEYAEKVVKTYSIKVAMGTTSRDAILETAKEYGVSDTQIYRYLRYKNVDLPKTERKRDATGKFTK